MGDRRKSVSILKPAKSQHAVVQEEEEETRTLRKVRFSSNFVKKFVTAEGDHETVWDDTYEEEIERSSALSLQSQSTSNSLHVSETLVQTSPDSDNFLATSHHETHSHFKANSNHITFETNVVTKGEKAEKTEVENLPHVPIFMRKNVSKIPTEQQKIEIPVNPQTRKTQDMRGALKDIDSSHVQSKCVLNQENASKTQMFNLSSIEADLDITKGAVHCDHEQEQENMNDETRIFNVHSVSANMDETKMISCDTLQTLQSTLKTKICNASFIGISPSTSPIHQSYQNANSSGRKTQLFDLNSEDANMDITRIQEFVERNLSLSPLQQPKMTQVFSSHDADMDMDISMELPGSNEGKTQVFDVYSDGAQMEETNMVSRQVLQSITNQIVEKDLYETSGKTQVFNFSSVGADMDMTKFESEEKPCGKTQVCGVYSEGAQMDECNIVPQEVFYSFIKQSLHETPLKKTDTFDAKSENAKVDFLPQEADMDMTKAELAVNPGRKTQFFGIYSDKAQMDETNVPEQVLHSIGDQSRNLPTRQTQIFAVDSEDAAMDETGVVSHQILQMISKNEHEPRSAGLPPAKLANATKVDLKEVAIEDYNVVQTPGDQSRKTSARKTQIFAVDSEDAAMDETRVVSNQVLQIISKDEDEVCSAVQPPRKTQCFDFSSHEADMDMTKVRPEENPARKTPVFDVYSDEAEMDETNIIPQQVLQSITKQILDKEQHETSQSPPKTQVFNFSSREADMDMTKVSLQENPERKTQLVDAYLDEVVMENANVASQEALQSIGDQSCQVMGKSGLELSRKTPTRKTQIFAADSEDATMEETLSHQILQQISKNENEKPPRKTHIFEFSSCEADVDITKVETNIVSQEVLQSILNPSYANNENSSFDSSRKTKSKQGDESITAFKPTLWGVPKPTLKLQSVLFSKKENLPVGESSSRKTQVFNVSSKEAEMDITKPILQDITGRQTQFFGRNCEDKVEATENVSNTQPPRKTQAFDCFSPEADMDITKVASQENPRRKTKVFDVYSNEAAMDETNVGSEEILQSIDQSRKTSTRKTQFFAVDSEDAAMEETGVVSHQILQSIIRKENENNSAALSPRKTQVFDFSSCETQVFDVHSEEDAMEENKVVRYPTPNSTMESSLKTPLRKTGTFDVHSENEKLRVSSQDADMDITKIGLQDKTGRKTQVFHPYSNEAAMDETNVDSTENAQNMFSKITETGLFSHQALQMITKNGNEKHSAAQLPRNAQVFDLSSREADMHMTKLGLKENPGRKTQLFDAYSDEAGMEETNIVSQDVSRSFVKQCTLPNTEISALESLRKIPANAQLRVEPPRKTLVFDFSSHEADMNMTKLGLKENPGRKTQVFDAYSDEAVMEETNIVSQDVSRSFVKQCTLPNAEISALESLRKIPANAQLRVEPPRKTQVFNFSSREADMNMTKLGLKENPGRKTQVFDAYSDEAVMEETNVVSQDVSRSFVKQCTLPNTEISALESMRKTPANAELRVNPPRKTQGFDFSSHETVMDIKKLAITENPGRKTHVFDIYTDGTAMEESNVIPQEVLPIVKQSRPNYDKVLSECVHKIPINKISVFPVKSGTTNIKETTVLLPRKTQVFNVSSQKADIDTNKVALQENPERKTQVFDVNSEEDAMYNSPYAKQSRPNYDKSVSDSIPLRKPQITDLTSDEPGQSNQTVVKETDMDVSTLMYQQNMPSMLVKLRDGRTIQMPDIFADDCEELAVPINDTIHLNYSSMLVQENNAIAKTTKRRTATFSFKIDEDDGDVREAKTPLKEICPDEQLPTTSTLIDKSQGAIKRTVSNLSPFSQSNKYESVNKRANVSLHGVNLPMEAPSIKITPDVHCLARELCYETPVEQIFAPLVQTKPKLPSNTTLSSARLFENATPSTVEKTEQVQQTTKVTVLQNIVLPVAQPLKEEERVQEETKPTTLKSTSDYSNSTVIVVADDTILTVNGEEGEDAQILEKDVQIVEETMDISGVEFISQSDDASNVNASNDFAGNPRGIADISQISLFEDSKQFMESPQLQTLPLKQIQANPAITHKTGRSRRAKSSKPRALQPVNHEPPLQFRQFTQADRPLAYNEDHMAPGLSQDIDNYAEIAQKYFADIEAERILLIDNAKSYVPTKKAFSMIEQIKEQTGSHHEYIVEEITDSSIKLLTRLGKYALTACFDSLNWKVHTFEMGIDTEVETELAKYINKFWLLKFSPNTIKSHIGKVFTIMSLLDYLECQLADFTITYHAVFHTQLLFDAILDYNQRLKYNFLTPCIDVEVIMDLSKILMDSVQTECIITKGPSIIKKRIDEIVLNTPRDPKYPFNVLTAVQKYLECVAASCK